MGYVESETEMPLETTMMLSCFSTHTHRGLVMLLENWRDVIRLLLCVVPDFVDSSFAVGCPATSCPVSWTRVTRQLSAAVWTQWSQSKRVRQIHVL